MTSSSQPATEETTIPESASEIISAPVTEAPSTQPDLSSFSTEQILAIYTDALHKTRTCTDSISVHHKESFSMELQEIKFGQSGSGTSNPIIQKLVTFLTDAIVKPTETDYAFSGGTAVNEEGETIPLLLPQKSDFTLTPDGIADAQIESSGDMLHVRLVLIDEKVGFGEKPAINAGAIGYLDTSELSFSILKIQSCTIDYTGSVIDAYIRSDGYIDSVTYVINMLTSAQASGLGLSGSGVLAGSQTEVWQINM